jgi:hypothetical protein
MNVGELEESEQVVLLALVGLMARADGSVSDWEMRTLGELREGIGARFDRVRDSAAALDDAEAILTAAGNVTRPDARELIFHTLVGMALPDTIPENEAELFRRLAKLWGLEAPL